MLMALVFALVGGAAQMVDGMLGMGFGVTSASLLTLLGYSAVAASAGTHAAKMGTTLVSGISHWRVGNVDPHVMLVLGVPGAIGGFFGALALTHITSNASRMWMAGILIVLGLVIIARYGFGRNLLPAIEARTRHLWPVGLIGGIVDSTGGGGWGPVATPSMLILTKHEPHRVVGTVNAAEFMVAVAASVGFLLGAGNAGVPWVAVLGLVLGGAITAPIAARLAHRAPRTLLGVLVGGMVLVANMAVFAKALGIPGAVGGLVALAIVVVVGLVAVRAHRAEVVVTGPELKVGV